VRDAYISSAQISVYPYIYHRDLAVIEYSQKHGMAIEAYEVSSSLIRSTEKGEFSSRSACGTFSRS
jgi:diketogulonate reductase-like aldo/keto reductase